MTDLRVEPYVIPAADLGPENPLPIFRAAEADRKVDFAANNVPEEDRPGLGWQTGFRVLPYRMQDGYNRLRQPRSFLALVLENEFLKVTVLPEVGGMVTSIIHKPLGRELLYCNPVFQPGNLALRNAWVSGGIEWNTAQLGHHYLTCSPVHAARVMGTSGEPVLRLYAWERVKCFPYQIDLHLPPASAFLFAHVRLINPHDHEIPMYWWTNMGVPEYPGGRVLCPADTAYHGAEVMECPVIKGIDHSYCTRVNSAYDLFFRIPQEQRPWVALIDREGRGVVHTSTGRLKGRKMFAWGMGPGSRRWNDYLSVPDNPFQEIQAGLAYTQGHLVPMPAETEWTWTEAIGYFESDPAVTHADDWRKAYAEADRILEACLPKDAVGSFHTEATEVERCEPAEVLFKGLGWGALENRRCAAAGVASAIPAELPFGEADLGEEQAPWLALLKTGGLPARDPQDEPGHYMIQDEWRVLLEESATGGKSDDWLAWLHLGVMKMEAYDTEGAREAWNQSLECAENAWALRNLSVLATRSGDNETACNLLRRALEIGPVVPALAAEYGNLLLQLERLDALQDFLGRLSEEVRSHERVLLLGARAALHRDDFAQVEAVLQHEFATIQEGEVSLSDLWFALQEKKLSAAEGVPIDEALRERVRAEFPPPRAIDFRMSTAEDEYVPPQDAVE